MPHMRHSLQLQKTIGEAKVSHPSSAALEATPSQWYFGVASLISLFAM